MRAYLSTPQTNGSGQLLLDSSTEIYRKADHDHAIVADLDGEVIELGLSDATVSRKKGGVAPVVINPQPNSIEILNQNNSNGVSVETGAGKEEIEQGYLKRVQRDAVVEIGYQTKLRLTVEREAREKYVVEGDIDTSGSVVFGDQQETHVDRSTSVGDDNVINRSDIGEEEPADVGDDNLINRSSVGQEQQNSDTQRYCEIHQVTYSGSNCPQCGSENVDGQSPEPADGDEFCIFCGTTVPENARFCLNCGEQLSEE